MNTKKLSNLKTKNIRKHYYLDTKNIRKLSYLDTKNIRKLSYLDTKNIRKLSNKENTIIRTPNLLRRDLPWPPEYTVREWAPYGVCRKPFNLQTKDRRNKTDTVLYCSES